MTVEHNIRPDKRIVMDHISRDLTKIKPNFLGVLVFIHLIELFVIEANLC